MHDDVSDLRDVVDAINRLCDTMKTSHYEDSTIPETDSFDVESVESKEFVSAESNVIVETTESNVSVDTLREDILDTVRSNVFVDTTESVFVNTYELDEQNTIQSDMFVTNYSNKPVDNLDVSSIVSPEEVSIRTVDPSERWSDPLMSPPLDALASDIEPVAQCEPASEMYYTASSEVSLLSDTEVPERVNIDEEFLDGKESKEDRKECPIAGHVAAMRERFESMTRTNTPCPDLMRSSSPSLDVFRNITPSPDLLG